MWQAVYQRLRTNTQRENEGERTKKNASYTHTTTVDVYCVASTHVFYFDCMRAHRNLISEFAFALRSLLSFYYFVSLYLSVCLIPAHNLTLCSAIAPAPAPTIQIIYKISFHLYCIIYIHTWRRRFVEYIWLSVLASNQ